MRRKPCRRRVITALPPRGLRPKLTRDQVIGLGLAHMTNLDLISKGQADESVLWQMVEGVFIWSRVAELLGAGVPEMAAQLEMAISVIERFGRTGKVGFSGTEYVLARRGVEVMDELAELVDTPTAVAAANWGEANVNRLSAQCGWPAAAPTAESAAMPC
jgi:hypothetical protein